MQGGGDENRGAQALHNLYVLVSVCSCLYMFVFMAKIKISAYFHGSGVVHVTC